MKQYQVQSKFRDGEWLDDHMPFDSKNKALAYIDRQHKQNYQYRILIEEYPDLGSKEYFDMHDCYDAIGGDWEG